MTIVDARRGVTAATATAADFTNHVPHNSHLLLQQLHCTTVITRIMITVQITHHRFYDDVFHRTRTHWFFADEIIYVLLSPISEYLSSANNVLEFEEEEKKNSIEIMNNFREIFAKYSQ